MSSDKPEIVDTLRAGSAKCVNWIGKTRENPNTRHPGSGFPVAGPVVGSETNEETKQTRFDYHLGMRIDVGWLNKSYKKLVEPQKLQCKQFTMTIHVTFFTQSRCEFDRS